MLSDRFGAQKVVVEKEKLQIHFVHFDNCPIVHALHIKCQKHLLLFFRGGVF